jgi:thiosulfate reductase cytochrome b subunit
MIKMIIVAYCPYIIQSQKMEEMSNIIIGGRQVLRTVHHFEAENMCCFFFLLYYIANSNKIIIDSLPFLFLTF